MGKRVIFSNDYCDMYDALCEELECVTSDEVYEEIERWYDDECANLDIPTKNRIICVAELQRWNGRFSAYHSMIGYNISDCLKSLSFENETITVYVDDKGELKAEKYGHDNPVSPSTFIFRELKDAEAESYEIENAWYRASKNKYQVLDRLSLPVGHYVSQIYGF